MKRRNLWTFKKENFLKYWRCINVFLTHKIQQNHDFWPLVFTRLPQNQVHTSDNGRPKAVADGNSNSHIACHWHQSGYLTYRSTQNYLGFLLTWNHLSTTPSSCFSTSRNDYLCLSHTVLSVCTLICLLIYQALLYVHILEFPWWLSW